MSKELFYFNKRRSQTGFSMVEMLMAAFVLAIGILGLTMLQTMSLRSSTGSRSLTTAVLVAERVMDEIEANGRNTLLYARNEPRTVPVAALTSVFLAPAVVPSDPPAAAVPPSITYNFAGRPSVNDPIDPTPYYSVYIAPEVTPGPLAPGVVAPVVGLGGIANMRVFVEWTETAGIPPRRIVFSRRVAYATA